jgi:release factor glutamine methyltransferase
MNANLLPQTPTINSWLAKAIAKLHEAGIKSASLDSELILADSIDKPRTYLHAHNDKLLNIKQTRVANSQLARRIRHEPIAYIIENKDFFGRKFIVTPDTLIPRPESEDFIEMLSKILINLKPHQRKIKLVDVGTGSGCLGITAKLEFPFLDVTLTDISKKAILIAKQNAKKYRVNVNIAKGNLLQNYHEKPGIIIANLPYVDESWERSPETDFEPHMAIFADKHGLSVNEQLIVQASDILTDDGYLIIEADPEQHSHLSEYANKHSFKVESTINYIISFKKL